jgi:TetR/AcrR family transcriptional regulator
MTPDQRRPTTRQRIMAAAERAFSTAGYAGARMEHIAAEAGVNKAALYYHIGNKQALYAAVLHRVFLGATERLQETITEDLTPTAKLEAYIRSFIRSVEENPSIPPIILRELASGGGTLPPPGC